MLQVVAIVAKASSDKQRRAQAADEVVGAVLRRAAMSSGMSLLSLLRLPQGSRRSVHDDITVVVHWLDELD